jgi:hypothetical protein
MTSKNQGAVPELESDPFSERTAFLKRSGLQIMGGRFDFRSNCGDLLDLVDEAYAGLPRHRFAGESARFSVMLRLTPPRPRRAKRKQPPALSMMSGTDLMAGAADGVDFAVLSPPRRTALISVSRDMLRFPYHVRYELIEFAVFTLASRAQGLVPLHAACVGLNGRGVLLMGESGAGKSTLSLQCLIDGFQFLAEDSVFVSPHRLLATGTPNFLHVRADSVDWLGRSRYASLIRKSPVIERRSGVKKFEVNLRRGSFSLAPRPLQLVGVVFLSAHKVGRQPLLTRLSKTDTISRMRAEQAYGASLPQWRGFQQRIVKMGGYELRRGAHPREGADALRRLLSSR